MVYYRFSCKIWCIYYDVFSVIYLLCCFYDALTCECFVFRKRDQVWRSEFEHLPQHHQPDGRILGTASHLHHNSSFLPQFVILCNTFFLEHCSDRSNSTLFFLMQKKKYISWTSTWWQWGEKPFLFYKTKPSFKVLAPV